MTFPKTMYTNFTRTIVQLISGVKDQVCMVITLIVIYNILFR